MMRRVCKGGCRKDNRRQNDRCGRHQIIFSAHISEPLWCVAELSRYAVSSLAVNENSLIRFRMVEYQEVLSIERLRNRLTFQKTEFDSVLLTFDAFYCFYVAICIPSMSHNELLPLFPSALHPAIPVASQILSTLRGLTAPGRGNNIKPEERAALVGVAALLGCERYGGVFSLMMPY